MENNVKALLVRAANENKQPAYICVDPATFDMLVPDKMFSMESPASGINMSGDAFYMGIPVVFVQKSGVQLGFRNARLIR